MFTKKLKLIFIFILIYFGLYIYIELYQIIWNKFLYNYFYKYIYYLNKYIFINDIENIFYIFFNKFKNYFNFDYFLYLKLKSFIILFLIISSQLFLVSLTIISRVAGPRYRLDQFINITWKYFFIYLIFLILLSLLVTWI